MNEKDFDPSGNDGRIAIQPGVGTLIFARPLDRDEAIYQCFAKNTAGTALTVKINLRQAILEPFQTSGIRRQYPNIGDSLQLKCTPPRSFPQANVFWATISSDMRFTPIDLSDRVTQDPIGNLNFVNVVAEDAKGGQTYACISQNFAMRSIQQGEYNVIAPRGQQVVYHAPALMWQSPTQQVALRGGSISIKCIFSGSPTPRVDWARTDGLMPGRARQESFGQQLTIDNVQYSDAGKYECQGINDEAMTPIRRSFSLTVESDPYWVKKPQSVDAAEGETAVFECEGEALPRPSYFWFLNGIPITKVAADPRRIATERSLTFTNMTLKDAQVIQCNVTNKSGYNFTNAYLNVLTEPPFILDPPVMGQKAAEGQTINLTCSVYGSPKPLVVWKKGNEQLTGGKFIVQDDGSLQITDVSLVDAGAYTCTASSRLGYTEATGTLIVRRKTTIVTKPLDMMVWYTTEAKFTCTATTDPDEVQNLVINWMKDGQMIDYTLAQRVFQNQMDNSLTISGTIYLDTGTYSCVASNGLDEDVSDAQLVVQAPPDPPVTVQVRCTNSQRQAEIWWQPGKENFAPILNFIVQFNTTFMPDTWYDIATNISQNDRRLVANLSPWGNYTFRVIARNKIGLSLPSMQTFNVCSTQPDVPTKNPENVIGEGDQPNNLVIFWTPMPRIEQNAPDFKYIVTWQQLNVSNAPLNSHTIQTPDAWHYVIPENNLPTYKPYRITVKANNAKGDSSANLNPVIGYSGEDVPLVAPTDVAYDDTTLTSTKVDVTWTQVDMSPENIRGFFRGYRIQFARVDEDWETSMREQDYIIREAAQYPRPRIMKRQVPSNGPNITSAGSQIRYTLYNIPTFAEIRLVIRVLNKYYAGPPSTPLLFTVPEGMPGPPASVSVAVAESTHFVLQWDPPNEPNGNILGYNISYQAITGLNLGRLQYREAIPGVDTVQARLTGLTPNTTYRIYLAAATVAGTGEPIFIDQMTTEVGAPSPPTFAIVELNDTYANITWEPSRAGTPGSIFYIQYRPRGHYEWLRSPDEYMRFHMALISLDPGTTYQVRVVAKNGDGYEAASVWLEFHTNGVAPGDFHLATSAWFYGIFICLLLIVLGLIALMMTKKYTDANWEEKERLIDEQVRQLQAEEAARQMGVFNQYMDSGSREGLDTSTDYYKQPLYDTDGKESGGEEYDPDYRGRPASYARGGGAEYKSAAAPPPAYRGGREASYGQKSDTDTFV